MDTVSKRTRSKIMSSIRSVSKMERAAHQFAAMRAGCHLVHKLKGVYGNPDFANKGRMVALFVHGCFWHRCQYHFSMPQSNTAFWEKKFARNVERHREVVKRLRDLGWRVVTVWEHEVRAFKKRRSGL